jgi:hypothetical protein
MVSADFGVRRDKSYAALSASETETGSSQISVTALTLITSRAHKDFSGCFRTIR